MSKKAESKKVKKTERSASAIVKELLPIELSMKLFKIGLQLIAFAADMELEQQSSVQAAASTAVWKWTPIDTKKGGDVPVAAAKKGTAKKKKAK